MPDLREMVFSALDSASDNGYDMSKISPTDIVEDLLMYDSDISSYYWSAPPTFDAIQEITPLILEWRQKL